MNPVRASRRARVVAVFIVSCWCGSILATPNSTPPPIGAPMRQLRWEQLANRDVSELGSEALQINPRAWYHSETENFIIHYRNFSDAL